MAELALRSRVTSAAALAAIVVTGLAVVARPERRRLSVVLPIALAVALGLLATIRLSPWVTAPALGLACAAMLLAGHDRLRLGLNARALGPIADDVLASIPWLMAPISIITKRANGSSGAGTSRALRGMVATAAVLTPLAFLLASADPVFGALLSQGVVGDFWSHLGLTVILVPVIALPIVAAHRPVAGQPTASHTPTRPGSMLEATMVLGGVALLLAAWGAIQVMVAVGGAERLLAAADLTAAENARQGFFQLVAVTALLVLVVLAVDRMVDRSGPTDRLRFAALTGLIALETIGVVVATYSRLALYVQGFGNTMPRIAAAWFLAWLAVVMILVVASANGIKAPLGRLIGSSPTGQRRLGSWLFLLAGLWVLAFGFTNPEATVATGNLQRSVFVEPTVDSQRADSEPGRARDLDVSHLVDDLGPDAVPAIVAGLADQPPETRSHLTDRLCGLRASSTYDAGFFGWNLSAARSQNALDSLVCPV